MQPKIESETACASALWLCKRIVTTNGLEAGIRKPLANASGVGYRRPVEQQSLLRERMPTTKETSRKLLREKGLRITAPRVAVLSVLVEAESPLSLSNVIEQLGDSDCDPATVYRNLIKLRDAELAIVVNRAGGIDRYALATGQGDDHKHPHFVCDDCGRVACLPDELLKSIPVRSMDKSWASSVRTAVVQLRGECPDCREQAATQA